MRGKFKLKKISKLTDEDLREYSDFEPTIPSNLPENINNDKLVFESTAYRKEFTGEPVPSVKQKCGDTLIQGSNNSLLHLTTEKFQLAGLNSNTDFTGRTTGPATTERQPMSPAIDLCVGRKREELEGLKTSTAPVDSLGNISIVKNLRGEKFSTIENYEINKVAELKGGGKFSSEEGYDYDATNCSARLYLSGDCAIDDVFKTSFDVLSGFGGTSIATFADNNRVVANTTLRLVNKAGQSFVDMDPEGNIVLKSTIDNGQQFLSLAASGTSRLQAKSSGQIQLSVSDSNEEIPEITVNKGEVIMQTSALGGIKAVSIGGSGAGVFGLGPIIKILDETQFFNILDPASRIAALTPLMGPFAAVVAPALSISLSGAIAVSVEDSVILSILTKLGTQFFFAE